LKTVTIPMTSIDLRAIDKLLYERLVVLMATLGFRPVRARRSFRRRSHTGVWAMHVGVIRHKVDLHATMDVAVRLDQVETLLERFEPARVGKTREQAFTLGVQLGALTESGLLRWVLASTDDLEATARSMLSTFASLGLPYLQRYSDPSVAYRLLSSMAPRDWMHCPIASARCLRAVALVHSLGRSEEIPALLHQCETVLKADPAAVRALSEFATQFLVA
jgi:hypothetical protein